MNHIILDSIRVQGRLCEFSFSCNRAIAGHFTSDTLWIEYEQDMQDVPESILTIPFISIMLPVMWMTNAKLWVKEIDRTFYDACFRLRRAYQEMYPLCDLKGTLVPCYLRENAVEKSKRSFLLFGGGVDAHTSYVRHHQDICGLINVQGWFEKLDSIDRAADADRDACADFGKRKKVDFHYVRSNFAKLISAKAFVPYHEKMGDALWHGMLHSLAFLSISIPLAYHHGISHLIIASSNVMGSHQNCASHPTTDVEFRYAEAGRVTHDGYELNRQDKIRLIVEHQKCSGAPYPLKVCSFNDHNCGICEKCFRTIMSLVAEGADIRQFGFEEPSPLLPTYRELFHSRSEHMALFGVYMEQRLYWIDTRRRMEENAANIQEKDLADWFLNYDFIKAKKTAIRHYYRRNFFSILRRKLFHQ